MGAQLPSPLGSRETAAPERNEEALYQQLKRKREYSARARASRVNAAAQCKQITQQRLWTQMLGGVRGANNFKRLCAKENARDA